MIPPAAERLSSYQTSFFASFLSIMDMDFLVFRLDWGIALHDPYDTGKSGYYNIPKFKDSMALHFAIGYPF